jgi:hypothetical protein
MNPQSNERERGVGSGEWGKDHSASIGGKYEDRILSRPGYLETGDGHCRGLLSRDPKLSERRVIRNDLANSQSERLGTCECCGRIWQREHQDYIRFLQIAQGSLKENETHLILSRRVELGQPQQINPMLEKCACLGKMFHNQIRSLQQKLM